uniref:VWFD domain-containing protein n=1 Tax=Sphaeramia orbicularis TaxID=375764 RepID=A0A673C2L7_9TELE
IFPNSLNKLGRPYHKDIPQQISNHSDSQFQRRLIKNCFWMDGRTADPNSPSDLWGQVCGLCGNYDGNSRNDFTTRSHEQVSDVLEFGNSWKISPSCPNAELISNPCTSNPYRASWAQKQCSIITSVTFQSCHSKVDPGPHFDNCVRDSCACDTGGDCECLCTAVAAYAKACNEAGACVKWRKPKLCPIFCDYYNSPGGCEWHYKPCGNKERITGNYGIGLVSKYSCPSDRSVFILVCSWT